MIRHFSLSYFSPENAKEVHNFLVNHNKLKHFLMKTRIPAFDAVKSFAIFLVVWGHSIQYLMPHDFFHNPMFELIYAFHMPLFWWFPVSSHSLRQSLHSSKWLSIVHTVDSALYLMGNSLYTSAHGQNSVQRKGLEYKHIGS